MTRNPPPAWLAREYPGFKHAGNGNYRVPCSNPSHPDKNPSVDVHIFLDGGAHFKCWSRNCTREEILSGINVSREELFPNGSNGRSYPPDIEWVYKDIHGNTLFKKVRYWGKETNDWRQVSKHLAGDGSWEMGLGDAPRVLLGLPELDARIKAGKAVQICEGEPDYDCLRELGYVATTNVAGANESFEKYVSQIAGAKVVNIWVDNDPAGRQRTVKIAKLIREKVGAFRIIMLPDLKYKGDVRDWIESGHTKEELDAEIGKVPVFRDTNSMAEVERFVNDREHTPDSGDVDEATDTTDTADNTVKSGDSTKQSGNDGATSETEWEPSLIPESVYEILPDSIKDATDLFDRPHERDVFLSTLLPVLSACAPYYRFQYRGHHHSPHMIVSSHPETIPTGLFR